MFPELRDNSYNLESGCYHLTLICERSKHSKTVDLSLTEWILDSPSLIFVCKEVSSAYIFGIGHIN